MSKTEYHYIEKTEAGDKVKVILPICGYCNNPISVIEPHRFCIRQIEDERGKEKLRQLEALDMKMFGEVMPNQDERMCRTYPDRYRGFDGMTYNERLKNAEERKQKEHQNKINARSERKRQLEYMRSVIPQLQRQVNQDEIDEAVEKQH